MQYDRLLNHIIMLVMTTVCLIKPWNKAGRTIVWLITNMEINIPY